MSDISPPAPGNLPEYSVSELSQALKRTVEETYSYVRVRGEISGFKRAASGHLYLALKDESAVLDAVCWRGTAGRLGIAPEDGLEVICTGKLTTYPGRSKYQIVIEALELAGEGALLKLLEERRKKLAAEGLFDAARKKPLPFLPDVIGVVTSPTGAVIRDILHRLEDRFPRHVLLWPVLVQGENAARQVAAAIEGFNRLTPGGRVPRPDVLIVARGGGSLEDLWAFNEEIVVRAAAASEIPLISAVGHETDTTLIDFASDRRAPTPTAAAEMAVPVRADLQVMVLDNARRLVACMQRGMDDRRVRLEGFARGLPDLDSLIGNRTQQLDTAGERLANAARGLLRERRQRVLHWAAQIKAPKQIVNESENKLKREAQALKGAGLRFLKGKKDRLETFADRLTPGLIARPMRDARQRLTACGDMLESLSYHRVLERGYAVVRDGAGKAVAVSASLAAGDAVSIEFADGAVGAQVTGAGPERKPAEAKDKPKPARPDRRQGRLL